LETKRYSEIMSRALRIRFLILIVIPRYDLRASCGTDVLTRLASFTPVLLSQGLDPTTLITIRILIDSRNTPASMLVTKKVITTCVLPVFTSTIHIMSAVLPPYQNHSFFRFRKRSVQVLANSFLDVNFRQHKAPIISLKRPVRVWIKTITHQRARLEPLVSARKVDIPIM
jgi:hypothetical protein